MPLLVRWPILQLPVPVLDAFTAILAEPAPTVERFAPAASAAHSVLQAPTFDWGTFMGVVYGAVAGALLLRLALACVMSWRLLRKARPYSTGVQLAAP